MKSLKRTLSLVLVLVMVLGLFGIAGAAFTDQKDAKYTEAIEVMTGIGAIDGYADGSVKPQGTITREEAAKLITYSILGKSVAENLRVGATGFTDVDAGRWSAPYIAFLVGKGIISGMGDGTFAPTANVTGYQMAKMMLCAAGYGANNEFTGTGWELAVAVTANKAEIFDGANGVDYTKAATREEAMLYAFNGIFVTQVEYNKVFGTYIGKGTGIGGGVGPTIASEVYRTDLTAVTVPGGVDGVASYYWTYKGKTISSIVANAKVLAKSTDGTAIADLANPSKSDYIGYQANTTIDFGTDEYVQYFLNGNSVGYDATGRTAVSASVVKGAVVKFLDINKDNKYEAISVTLDTVSKVTATPTTKTTGAVTTVTVAGVLGLSNIDSTKVFGYEGLAKGDYVLWHKDDADRFFLTKAQSVTGTLMAMNETPTKEVLMIDGVQYKLSGLNGASTVADNKATLGKAGTVFYLDQGGFVVKTVPAESAVNLDNTLFVVSSQAVGYAAQAMVVLPDGTSAVVTPAKVDTTNISAANVAAQVTANTFYTYTKNDNGSYNLGTISNTQVPFVANDAADDNNTVATGVNATLTIDDTMAKISKSTANFMTKYVAVAGVQWNAGASENVLATATTAFTYRNETTKAYSTVKGISSAASYIAVADGSTIAYLCDSNGYAIWVVGYGGEADATSSSADYVFAALPATTIYNAAGNYYMYTSAVVNGAIGTLNATTAGKNAIVGLSPATLGAGTLFAVTAYENGRAAAVDGTPTPGTDLLMVPYGPSIAATGNLATDDIAVNGTTVSLKDNTDTKASFILTDDAKVFIYDATKTTPTITAATTDDISNLMGGVYMIQGVKKSLTDSRIDQLYVTILATNTDVTAKATASKTVASVTTNFEFGAWSADTGADVANAKAATATPVTGDATVNIKLTVDPNASVFYSIDGGTTFVASTGTENVIVNGADETVHFKVVNGSATCFYALTLDQA